jgi:hypothetical protein
MGIGRKLRGLLGGKDADDRGASAPPAAQAAPAAAPSAPAAAEPRASQPATPKRAERARIRLCALHEVHFDRVSPPAALPIHVSSISPGHISFMRVTASSWPAPGTELSGNLVFDSSGRARSFPIRCKLVATTRKTVDCELVPDPQLSSWINGYFRVESIAATVRLINPKYHRREPDGPTSWYFGENNCSLYFVLDDQDRVRRFALTMLGNYFEGGPGRPLVCGSVVDDGSFEKLSQKGSELIRPLGAPSAELMEQVSRFLINIPALKPHHRLAIGDAIASAR